jgi:predicted alpha/beta-fold hydrolase
LDLAESGEDFSFLRDFDDVIIMETGGMKDVEKSYYEKKFMRY